MTPSGGLLECFSRRAFDHLEALTCTFCKGRLRFDFDRKEKAPSFTYYRCEECRMPNVFAAPADATT